MADRILHSMQKDPANDTKLAELVAKRYSTLCEDLVRLRDDAGISRERLGFAAGVDPAFLRRIEAGTVHASIETYQRLAMARGADLSTRLYANTGPRIRDHTQAPMLELLLATRDARFAAYTEVGVKRPSRGWIDAVLHDTRDRALLATELQGQLRRLEQQIRWHRMKAESLPSWDGWRHLGADEEHIGQLLIVRRTRATRAVAAEFARQLRTAYPAHPDDALAALTGTETWPGNALAWMVVENGKARWATGR